MIGYVVKDMDGEVLLFTNKPRKNNIRGWWESTSFKASASLDEKALPSGINPSWDDEIPIKVRIELNRL